MKNMITRHEMDTSISSWQALYSKPKEMARERAIKSLKGLEMKSIVKSQKTLHKRNWYQIEWEMQNEELRHAQLELETERERYFDLYDLAPVGYCILSEEGLIMETNLTAANILEAIRGSLTKQSITQMIVIEDRNIYYLFRKKLAVKGEPQECELRMMKMDGTVFWAHLIATVATNTYGALECRIAFTDITDRKKRETEIFNLSYHDQLTGLFNRRFYEEELKRLDTERNLPLAIVMGDVNGLKLINDSFGHLKGDELLIKVAEVITKGCRTDDIIARLGGDEFVILLPKTDAQETEQIIKRIKALALKEKIESVDISISFGFGVKSNSKTPIQEIFKKAEDHMYRQKLLEGTSMRGKMINGIINAIEKKKAIDENTLNKPGQLTV